MNNIEVQTPLHGAAFRVLYEATQPAFCSTRTRQAEINEYFSKVRLWSKEQPSNVRQAYEWALTKLTADIQRQISASDMGNAVEAAYRTIPKMEE